MDEQLKQQILQQIGPDVIGRMVNQVLSKLQGRNVTAQDLQPLIQLLMATMEDPRVYPQVVQALERAKIVKPGQMPEQFEPTIVGFLLLVMTEVARALQQSNAAMPANFARGGLTQVARQLQSMGRGGDTMLAHINPQEAALLKAMGGSGTINPHTGLREFGFFDFVSNIVSDVGDALSDVGDAIGDAFSGAVDAVQGVVQSLGPIAPILVAVMAPYAIPALAGSIGISSLAAGALYGAGTSALLGQNPLTGAVMGALGGGLGTTVGGAASDFMNLGLDAANQALLGNTLVGGALGAATGQGFGKGALGAATGTMLGNAVGNLAGSGTGTALGEGLTQAGKTIGYMTTAGIPLKQAVIGGALSGLTAGALNASRGPSDIAGQVETDMNSQIERVNKLLADPTVPEAAKQAYSDYLNQLVGSKETFTGYKDTLANAPKDSLEYKQAENLITKPGTGAYGDTRGIYQELGVAPPPQAGIGSTKVGLNMPTAIVAASAALPFALDSLAKAQTPQDVQNTIKAATTSNPEYFNNLRLTSWDWDAISKEAATAGVPLGVYVASNWNKLTQGSQYTSPGSTQSTDKQFSEGLAPNTTQATQAVEPAKVARGGALSKVAYLARGAGSGRADTIDARLSDGEYVIDAETVAMLGDGSTQAGAAKLDQMRRQIRQHKGRALAKGKFSPNAKSPLNYLKGAL